MKVQIRTGNAFIEGSGDTQKEVFKQIAELQEIFGEQTCRCCNGDDISFRVRTVEDNEYYEMVCNNRDCRAKLEYGQMKKGGKLFPKRFEGEGDDRKVKGNWGWYIWKPE